MLKAVLFDMDGVIVDTEPLHHKAYFGMFNTLKINVSETHYQSFTGQSTINVCKSLCNHFKLSNNPEELVQIKRQVFKDLFKKDPDLQLLDGVLDLIKEYHEKGLTLVLASSASMGTIDSVFTRFELDKYFITKLSGADLKASKPHPEIFLNAAEASGYLKENCMVIEDSTNGIKAANAADIFCVGYKSLHSKNQDYSKANVVINDFKEISYSKVQKLFRS
ncbi:HAD family phosphatase [Xanthomarina sp. GH4-25]|jgi:beta-phosphoglucomutase|uniref:HAD family hydrolase n=1 Tax=Xanthomarina sp. GH4-25 TaxID=3349335 RepID=UPI000D674231|nr:ABC transporter ATP-binding protein [Flavobacteriaceae bacterium LYZ1037]